MSELESLDTRGLLCPLPVIRTQDRVKALPAGTLLTVVATGPGTLQDIPAWCRVQGHELLETETLPGDSLHNDRPVGEPDSKENIHVAGTKTGAEKVASGIARQQDTRRSSGGPVFRFRIRVMDS